MRITRFFNYTGIYMIPVCWLIEMAAYLYLSKDIGKTINISPEIVFAGILISLLPTLKIWSTNSIRRAHGQTEFHFLDGLEKVTDEYSGRNNKSKYAYPVIPDELLRKDSEAVGMVVGRDRRTNRYIQLPPSTHLTVLAPTGGGKTSGPIISSLLLNHLNDAKRRHVYFVTDIKKEIRHKATFKDEEKILCFDPDDRTANGWDILGNLNDDSTMNEVKKTMEDIVFSMIILPKDGSNAFWKIQPRDLLLAELLFEWQYVKRRNFIDMCKDILSMPARDFVEKINQTAKPSDVCYMLSISFVGMNDDTFGGIYAEAYSHLKNIALDNDLVYALRDCPKERMITPDKLEEGYSIMVCLAEEDLTRYREVLRILITMVLKHCECRNESGFTDETPEIHLILDEWPRICSEGYLEKADDSYKTLRSKRCSITAIYQNIEAGYQIGSENQMAGVLSNSWLLCLGANSVKTQEMLSKMCGTYREANQSFGCGKHTTSNLAFEERPVVDVNTLQDMDEKEEAVLITSKSRFYRVKKIPYFKNRKLSELSQKMMESYGTGKIN